MHRKRLSLAALLLPTCLGVSLVAASTPSDACGPYGAPEPDLVGQVMAQHPSNKVTVRAYCDDDTRDAMVFDDGSFEFYYLPDSACLVVATAHETFKKDRHAVELVGTSGRSALTLVIPD